MTLSDASRSEAMEIALTTMLAELRDRAFTGVHFAIASEPFATLPQTTWLELEGEMFVEPRHSIGNWAYRMTGRGWIAALRLSGQFESDELRDRAVALRSALKDLVKGRALAGVSTDLFSIHAKAGLHINWLQNALDSRLMQHIWPSEHLDLDLSDGLRHIRVPARFGSRRLGGMMAGPFADP